MSLFACLRACVSSLIGLSCLCVFATACGGPSYQHVVERPLVAADHLSCSGYLVWDQEPVRDVFLVINGSGLLSNAFVHPSFEQIVSSHRVAYATYDKPGVRAPFGDPAAVHRDDALLQQYTLGHGVECANGALHWAREQFGPAVRLHLRGHSEGVLVALYAYEALLEAEPATASSIASLVLSGVPLDPFGDILAQQLQWLPDSARVRSALSSCDWGVLSQRLGVSCAYIEDAKRRPSGRTMFERLAARSPSANFYIVHGTNDRNTPVEPVRALQAWNASDKRLNMEFHYYQGGHMGSEAGRAEAARVLRQLIR